MHFERVFCLKHLPKSSKISASGGPTFELMPLRNRRKSLNPLISGPTPPTPGRVRYGITKSHLFLRALALCVDLVERYLVSVVVPRSRSDLVPLDSGHHETVPGHALHDMQAACSVTILGR